MDKEKEIIVGLAIVAAIFVVFSAVSYFEYSITNSNYKELKGKYSNLMEEKNSSVSYWQTKYNSLQSQYNSLQNKYNSLNSSYNTLQNSYNNLQSQYNDYKDMVNMRTPSGSEKCKFITPSDDSVKTKTASVLGSGFDGDLSDREIDKINDWVHNNIDYSYDVYVGEEGHIGTECWQYPSETLKLSHGDCEDQALLVASMCLSQEKVGWLYVAEVEFSKDDEKMGHVCIFLNIEGDKMVIADPIPNNDDLFNPGGWISTEARSEPSALDDYRKAFGYDSIRVKSVFNMDVYKTFSSNDEFYNWF